MPSQCLEMDELLDDALRADIYLKQGYALLYLQRFEEALTALDTCLTLLPGAADAMLLKLQAYAAMGDAQAAREQAEAYLADVSRTDRSLFCARRIARGCGRLRGRGGSLRELYRFRGGSARLRL